MWRNESSTICLAPQHIILHIKTFTTSSFTWKRVYIDSTHVSRDTSPCLFYPSYSLAACGVNQITSFTHRRNKNTPQWANEYFISPINQVFDDTILEPVVELKLWEFHVAGHLHFQNKLCASWQELCRKSKRIKHDYHPIKYLDTQSRQV